MELVKSLEDLLNGFNFKKSFENFNNILKKAAINIAGDYKQFNGLKNGEKVFKYVFAFGGCLTSYCFFEKTDETVPFVLRNYFYLEGITSGLNLLMQGLDKLDDNKVSITPTWPGNIGVLRIFLKECYLGFSEPLKESLKNTVHFSKFLKIQKQLRKEEIVYANFVSKVLIQKGLSEITEEKMLEKIQEYTLLKDYIDINKIDTYKITTGSRQLIIARYLNLKKKFLTEKSIIENLNELHSKLKNLEEILQGTPSFGCELIIDADDAEKIPFLDKKISLANELLYLSGSKEIRACERNKYEVVELRISPSYAPITIALINELFDLEIIPPDIQINYAVNIVGNEVIDYAIPLIIVNFFTGLTPYFEWEDDAKEDDISFRDVHVYRGITIDSFTGEKKSEITQLNIVAGFAAKVLKNKELLEYKSELKNDVSERYKKMLLPFLVGKSLRNEWEQKIYSAVGINQENVEFLKEKLKKAEGDMNIWKTKKDLNIKGSYKIDKKIKLTYKHLINHLKAENLELYEAVMNSKL